MGYRGALLSGWFDSDPAKKTSFRLANKAGQVMTQHVRLHTPVDTGHLKESITEKPTLKRGADRWESGAETEVEYAPYVEEGTGLWGPHHAPYEIRPRKPGGVLSWIDPFTGKRIFAKRVIHPGIPGSHMFAIGVALTEAEFPTFARPILQAWAREQGRNNTYVVYGKPY